MKFLGTLLIGFMVMSCNEAKETQDKLDLKDKLSGKWQTKAFDGELHETWTLEENGWMQQEGYYIENQDTTYSAKTRIEKIDETVILFSVIKNSTPKIFKAVKINENEIVFLNEDYNNPYQVTYQFIDNNNYVRTIEGRENDSLVIYKFEFKKIE